MIHVIGYTFLIVFVIFALVNLRKFLIEIFDAHTHKILFRVYAWGLVAFIVSFFVTAHAIYTNQISYEDYSFIMLVNVIGIFATAYLCAVHEDGERQKRLLDDW